MGRAAIDIPLVHRTAHIRLRVTRHQADRCYGLMRSAGDLWAWLLDTNRERLEQGAAPIVGYQALCRQLTARGPVGELSAVGPGRCWAGTRTPGTRRPSADAMASGLGSHAANACWSRFASTTRPSGWRASVCGCRSPGAARRYGCGWPDLSRIQPTRSGQ